MKLVKNSALLLASIMAVLFFGFNIEKTKAAANVWEYLDYAGFHIGGVSGKDSMAMNPSTHEMYVAVKYNSRISVMKFNGSAWGYVGSQDFTSGISNYAVLEFNPVTNEPYVIYTDGASGDANVKKFDGSSWVDVGSLSRESLINAITFDPVSGVPYVFTNYNPTSAAVYKYDSGSWTQVSSSGFSVNSGSYKAIAFDVDTNLPWVTYTDSNNLSKITVKKFDGVDTWSLVGSAGFSATSVFSVNIAFDSLFTPYVAYQENPASTGKAMVKKFDGSSWVDVGTPNEGMSYNVNMKIDPDTHRPYITYSDGLTSNSTVFVDKYNGTAWERVGSSQSNATDPTLEFNSITKEPYVVFYDYNAPGVSAIKFNSNTVVTPIASPTGGTYSSPQSVTLSTTTSGAFIHYTTDGSTPTTGSTLYSGAITISQNTQLRAIAEKLGMTTSDAMSVENYYIEASIPTASPAGGTYSSSQSVTLSTTTSGATIHYTTDGSAPSGSSTLYSGAIEISQNTNLKAIAHKSGMNISDAMNEIYVIKNATPTASPAGATFTSAQSVTLSTATSGASIYYTIDGSVPTASSTLYSGAITVGASETIKAIALKSGMGNSDVMSESYVINIPGVVSTPTASPSGGTYTSDQTVSLSTSTSGATIYYTNNGSDPTISSTQYTGPLSITSSTTLKAFAIKDGMTDSSIMTSSYTINKSSGSSSKKKSSSHKKKKKKSSPKYTVSSVSAVPYGGVLVQSGKKFTKNGNVAIYQSQLNGTYYPPKIVRASATGSFSMATKMYKARGKYSWYAVNLATGKKSKIKTYTIR